MNWHLVRVWIGSIILGTVIVLAGMAFNWGGFVDFLLTFPAGVLLYIVEGNKPTKGNKDGEAK